MKIQLLGAAQTVTGSCYIVETENARFAVDCGMHQGNTQIEQRNRNVELYRGSELDFILLTHAHIDHSGLLPLMAKDGFTGPVYCTEPTLELLEIMLLDSAHIQEMEAEWASRKKARRGGEPVEALYSTDDAITITKQLKSTRYDRSFDPAPGISVCFRDAGHILGSSFLELSVRESEGVTSVIFSGDIGRPDSLIVNDPAHPLNKADYLFMESTYGDRDHKNEDSSRDELAEAIAYSYAQGEKTIIPAFAVERTQEVLYALYLLSKEGRLPDIPIFVDSPLAIKATKIFNNHPEYFDNATKAILRSGENPFSLPNLKYTLETKDSQAINTLEGPAIVISASGMCNAGRIKHHLKHNLWRHGASIVFTGYQGIGTPGRKIVDGEKVITLLGEPVEVNAKVYTIGGFSAHAGQSQILDWVGAFARPELKIFLVHGEETAQEVLAELMRERFKMHVEIPDYLETLVLESGKEPQVYMEKDAQKAINWAFLLSETENKMAQLKSALVGVGSRRWADQTEIQEDILDLNKRILHIVSQL
ncbi:MBL fold metallo-hydrolase [Desulfovibrio sp. OttesenSCG-928-G15]|nr:MBL fold metallo-hydrolase [Desulfovibrio sp. OttesenSCG-928-G15]